MCCSCVNAWLCDGGLDLAFDVGRCSIEYHKGLVTVVSAQVMCPMQVVDPLAEAKSKKPYKKTLRSELTGGPLL